MKRLLGGGLMFFLAACASVPKPALERPTGAIPYDAWERVLKNNVDEQGRVNFSALEKDSGDLDHFVAWIYDNGPKTQPAMFPTANDVLAYHINAYNALAMYKVIHTGIPKTLSGFGKVSFFYFGKLRVDGEELSLYAYENDVIRKFGEPRVHFALNCMSVGCPRLPRERFKAERLDVQLDYEANIFFSESRNLHVDANQKVANVSEILQFYTEDFLAQSPSLIAYINRYKVEKIPEDLRVEFIPYDWTINKQPDTSPRP